MRQIAQNKTRDRIFKFLHSFYEQHGYAPTVRDILKGCQISSTAVVQHHLVILQREGMIQRDPEIFRSIRFPVKTGTNSVPLMGVIAAGKPIPVPSSDTSSDQPLERIELPQEITGNKEVFALRVKGQSMIDALIDDGDIVLMESANTAVNGEMVAVWIKDRKEVTLKRIFVEQGKVWLKPANQTVEPILQRPENIEIQGKVIGVIRKL
jgi:repressor LexA